MNRRAAFALLVAAALLTACSQKPANRPSATGHADFDKAALEAGIDRSFGGIGTCVVLGDTRSGAEVYRYNSNAACMNLLPPCQTFAVPAGLIGLDAGLVTPKTTFKWDKSPQPVRAWERDTDMTRAFKERIGWWQSSLARKIGPATFQARLKDFDYGNKAPEGPIDSFWMGPSAGGRLGLSTRQQAEFLHRLYDGKLKLKPETQAAMESLLADEQRGGLMLSSTGGDCGSNGDSSRRVAWWIGRLKGPTRDYVFAASIEGESDNALPARELQIRGKSVFAAAGLWPAA